MLRPVADAADAPLPPSLPPCAASDGVFDVLSSQQAVNFVRRKLHEHGELQRAATQLVNKALWSGSTDNASAVVVALNQQWAAPSPPLPPPLHG